MTREECTRTFGQPAREAWTIAAKAGVPKFFLSLLCDWHAGRISDEDKRHHWPERLYHMTVNFHLESLGEFERVILKAKEQTCSQQT